MAEHAPKGKEVTTRIGHSQEQENFLEEAVLAWNRNSALEMAEQV